MKMKPWYRITGIISDALSINIETLKELNTFFETAIEKEKAKKEKELEMRLANAKEEEERADISDFYANDFYYLEDQIPLRHRYSMVISSYSLLEQTMMRFCEFIKRRNPLIPKPKFGRAIIWRAKDYISNYGGVRFRATSRRWKRIVKYNQIRNLIVHNEGKVEKSQVDSLKKQLRSLGMSKLDQNRQICLEKGFINEMIKTIEEYLLYEMLRDGPGQFL